MSKIIIEKYNPQWEQEFLKAQKFYQSLLNNIDCEIVHVGSTAIKGLWAKPILDIDIIANNTIDMSLMIDLLKSVGYQHLGDLNVKGREAFSYDLNNPQINWMNHHLYLCLKGNENLRNHLLLKKHLTNNQEACKRYSQLKIQLAKQYSDDIDKYIAGKTALILEFLKAEGLENEALKNIAAINK